MSRLQMGR